MYTSYNPKDEILQSTQQGLRVFQHYLPQWQPHGKKQNINAVFRDDGKNADASISYSRHKNYWYYHDFVTGEHLSPFDFVMKWHHCDFKTALEIIHHDILHQMPHQFIETKNTQPSERATTKQFTLKASDQYSYWLDFAPKQWMLEVLQKYGVSSLHSYQITENGKTYSIQATAESPIFAFAISDQCYKLYRPHAEKKYKHSWLGQKPESYTNLFGLSQLPEYSETILIVEGLKDTIVANANGFIAVGTDNAATRITQSDLKQLKAKCKHLLLCYDMDQTGKEMSQRRSAEAGLKTLHLPDELVAKGGKDISDYFRLGFKAEALQGLIEEVIRQPNEHFTEEPTRIEQARLSKFAKVEQYINGIYDIRYNEVSNELEYRKRELDDGSFQTLNENNIFRFLQHNSIEFSQSKLSALLRSDFVPRYDPFHEYFQHLTEWCEPTDPDYIERLCTYLKVKDTNRFSVQFKKMLVRTIACALTDHIVNKQAFILVHEEQNSGKSTFVRWLCPPVLKHYMAENISTDKDSLICLSDNFIINMDELATLTKTEINSLKSMFSKETIKIRRPYDKAPTSAPRRASFFGSTNKAEFLTDETGSVRWLCFELTERINWDYKKDLHIDDIWRQAYSLYNSGFKYELTPDEIRENEEANQQYQLTTPELELIQKELVPASKDDHEQFCQATDILYFIGQKYENIKLNLNNIGKALKLLGFERTTKRSDKYPVKGYFIKYKKA